LSGSSSNFGGDHTAIVMVRRSPPSPRAATRRAADVDVVGKRLIPKERGDLDGAEAAYPRAQNLVGEGVVDRPYVIQPAIRVHTWA